MGDRVCVSCGSEWGADFNFCPNDGAALMAARPAIAHPVTRDFGRPVQRQRAPRLAESVRELVRALAPRADAAVGAPIDADDMLLAGPAFAERVYSTEKLHHPAALCDTAAYPRPGNRVTQGETESTADAPAQTRRGALLLRALRGRAR